MGTFFFTDDIVGALCGTIDSSVPPPLPRVDTRSLEVTLTLCELPGPRELSDPSPLVHFHLRLDSACHP
jgi:hypothetical protein